VQRLKREREFFITFAILSDFN